MSNEKSQSWLRQYTQEDMAVSFLRVGLSAAGPVGAIIGEFATQLVPKQRMDRLEEFSEFLQERLGSLEEQFKARLQESAGYSALAEDVTMAAVRTASSPRRQELAALLVNSISTPDAELIEQQVLVRALDQINDVQLLLLMLHGSFRQTFGNQDRAAFLQKHEAAVSIRKPSRPASEADVHRWNVQQYYLRDLIAKGLLMEHPQGSNSHDNVNVQIAPLGRLLLRSLGHPVEA